MTEVLRRLAEHSPPTDSELIQLLDQQPITTGLDHWALWTLACLHRHLDRQKWVGFIVESRLKGDLRQIGCAGAFGHPQDLPQSGDVPGEPEWRYYFHGCGCCLTSKVNGTHVDVDFTGEGGTNRIDRFFYSNFLLSLQNPEFPESAIRRNEPFEHAWQVEINRLSAAKCVDAKAGLQLTPHGLHIAESIASLGNEIARLKEWGTPAALRNLTYAGLAAGDVILANESAPQVDVSAELRSRIVQSSEEAIQLRFKFLKGALQEKDTYKPSCLSAIADFGPELAEETVLTCLFQSPVEGAANTALEIIQAWNHPRVIEVLKELLNRRYSALRGFRSILTRLNRRGQKAVDQQPREYQVVRASLALLQRVRPDSLNPDFRSRISYLIENSKGAQAGEAALLMYRLDQRRGLDCLRRALAGGVPAAQEDAAAACVIIGNAASEQILKDALVTSDAKLQHTAACALAAFESKNAQDLARRWFAQNDGIKDPLGKEVTVLGRTAPVFTFDDVTHANMDAMFKWSLERLQKDFKSVF